MSEPLQTSKNEIMKIPNDGFDVVSGDDRLIRGEILRCVDGHWSLKDGTPIATGTRALVLGVNDFLQHWREQQPIETITREPGKALPDLDELNGQIPKEQWEEGLDGQPRPPWVHAYAVYLLNLDDASIWTFVNSTIGARIAFDH